MRYAKRLNKRLPWVAGALTVILIASACANNSDANNGDVGPTSAGEDTPEEDADLGNESGAEVVEIAFAVYQGPTHPHAEHLENWANEINSRQDEVIFEVEMFYSEGLLSAAEVVPGVGDGRADMGHMATAYHPAELPMGNVVGLPFITSDSEAQARALNDVYDSFQPFAEEWHAQNLHLITMAPLGPNIIAAKDPISSVDDLEGLSMRTLGLVERAMAAVGVNTVSLTAPEIYEALERGVIDATTGYTLDAAVLSASFHEVAPYIVGPGTGLYAIHGVVMNLDLWNSLSEEVQGVINDYRDEWISGVLESMVDEEQEACDVIAEAGGEVSLLPEEEVRAWEEQVRDQIEANYLEDLEAAGVPADDFYESYLEALERRESESTYEPGIERCAS